MTKHYIGIDPPEVEHEVVESIPYWLERKIEKAAYKEGLTYWQFIEKFNAELDPDNLDDDKYEIPDQDLIDEWNAINDGIS